MDVVIPMDVGFVRAFWRLEWDYVYQRIAKGNISLWGIWNYSMCPNALAGN